jgi:hypothetical protein
MCADIEGGSTTDGTRLIAFPCRGQTNDTFFKDTSATEPFKSGSLKCMSAGAGTIPPVLSQTCAPAETQRFATVNVEWRGLGNKCVNDNGDGTLVMADCNGGIFQRWDFFHPDGLSKDQIRRSGTNSCVSRASSNGTKGEHLTMAPCSFADMKQRFVATVGGQAGSLNALNSNGSANGLCATVEGGVPPLVGRPLVLWDACNINYTAVFTLNGEVKTSGKCMQIQGIGSPFDPLVAGGCTDSAALATALRTWEYYF